MRSLVGGTCAMADRHRPCARPNVRPGAAAQGGAPSNCPPRATRGNLPLRNVPASYSARRKAGLAAGLLRDQQIKPNGQTPRDADGHPDLSGNWGAGFPNPIGQPGLRRRVGSKRTSRRCSAARSGTSRSTSRSTGKRSEASTTARRKSIRRTAATSPVGVPRQNVPGRIVQKNGQIWLLNNVENGLRILPLDNRKRDENDLQYSTYNGKGLAHWDGDTLVVDSVGFNDVSWLGWEGYFHSDKMEVTERFTRVGDLLYYNFTVNDPDVLLEPWNSYTYVRRLNPNPNRQEEATECDERDLGAARRSVPPRVAQST